MFPLLDATYINSPLYCVPTSSENQIPEMVGKAGVGGWCFDQEALQQYLLAACQDMFGGLMDKPGKGKDFYHTCYCLSGMSIAQHNPFYLSEVEPHIIFGDPNTNLIQPTHFLYNIGLMASINSQEYFSHLPPPTTSIIPSTKSE
eukprot:TRINITY_DN11133_c0_g1_i4.p1 TRINITY_DN11133_c0_g1~~TRINITY_DN11133_c0_g1_i4.p1  ORF type:complete len:158 (-),score=45.85 TRINITY_DN11133_c0_g1_i4:79-513(-)